MNWDNKDRNELILSAAKAFGISVFLLFLMNIFLYFIITGV